MDDPIQEITDVVHRLTQGSPRVQQDAINTYFTPDASFTHPFCRTGSYDGSRQLIHSIFRWYKVMSPKIDLTVNSVALDESNLILYVNISQVFAIWLIPFHRSPVTLTTVLQLVRKPGTRKYYIQSQNDLYQTDQFVKFFAPWGIGSTVVLLWQLWATFLCVVAAYLTAPFTSFMQSQEDRKESSQSSQRRAPIDSKPNGDQTSGSAAAGKLNDDSQQFGRMQVIKPD